jgi:HD-like signal output (HDOD) protein
MNESEHLYELLCDAHDPRANLAALNQHELILLANHIAHVIKRNGGHETGIPGLCKGLVEMEAAERFLK